METVRVPPQSGVLVVAVAQMLQVEQAHLTELRVLVVQVNQLLG
jgi:hypothetical protein